MRKIKKNLENVEKIFYTFMQIVNIIFGGKLFRFFWILYGEIGGFSSLFTLYGYYIRYVYVWIHHSIKYGLFNE